MNTLFKTKGPLTEEEAHLYVERTEDAKVRSCVRSGDYVTLIGARQTGKTSLLYKLRTQMRKEGWVTFLIDVSPPADSDKPRWYEYLTTKMQIELNVARPGAFVIPKLEDQLDFEKALWTISRTLSCPIVFMLDEVGTIPEAVADSFLATIRAIFNNKHEEEFRRYVFVLGGTFVPDELMKDTRNSPFNIAEKVYMSDADEDSIAKLVKNLEKAKGPIAEDVIRQIYHWTGGHLYLTQRLCAILATKEQPLTVQVVDAAVEEIQRDDDNIRHVRKILDRDEEIREAIYHIMVKKKRPFDRITGSLTPKLELTGLIKADAENNCVVRNRIYERWLRGYFKERFRDQSPLEVVPDKPGVLFDENGDVWVVIDQDTKRRIPRQDFRPLEHGLLKLLHENKGKVCRYQEIGEKVWGLPAPPIESIQGTVRDLRKKIEPDPNKPRFIITVRTEGYRLVDPENPSALCGRFVFPLFILGKHVLDGVLMIGKGLLELARWMDEILAVTVVLAIIVLVVLVLSGRVDPERILKFVERLLSP